MKQFTFKKKLIAGTAVAALALGVSGTAAFAYWTAGGTGTGSATTFVSFPVTVNQTSNNAGLVPGGATALKGDFTNTANAGSVYITAVTASIGTITPSTVLQDATKPACTPADFSITGSAPVGAEVANGTHVGAWSGLSLNMTDTGANQDNCKKATVTIVYTAN
jgi:hypothetical protein